MAWESFVVMVAALVAGGPFVLGPPLIKHALKPLLTPEWASDDARGAPAEVMAYLLTAEGQLARAGFRRAGLYRVRTELAGTQAWVMLLRGPDGCSLAYAAALPRDGGFERYVELGTQFEDGTALTVGNARLIGPFRQRPGSLTVQVPWVQDGAALWTIHQAFARRQAAGRRAQPVPRGDEIATFVAAIQRTVEHQRACGYVQPAGDGVCYRLTWRGACRFTWLTIQPIAGVRQWWRRRRDAGLLRAATAKP